MAHKILKNLKMFLPRNIKEKIKNVTGFGMVSNKVNTLESISLDSGKINVAIYTGGGLGDFIVYSLLVEQLVEVYDCDVYIFTLSYENAKKIFKDNCHVKVCYPFNLRKKQFDIFFEMDHYVHVRTLKPLKLRIKSKEMYEIVQQIIRYNASNIPSADTVNSQRLLIITRARFLNLNRWTMLSCGGVFNMSSMRTRIPIRQNSDILTLYELKEKKYITIHFGTDPDAGGILQTKLWPYENFREFVKLFKLTYPNIQVVQVAANKETLISGVDICIRNAELEDVSVIFEHAITHVSSEGGMAHLATQTGIRCVVVFGPTPAYYYGYPTNINIVSPRCKECMEVLPDWFVKCPRKLENAECMSAISSEVVMNAVQKIVEYNG